MKVEEIKKWFFWPN